MWVSLSSDGPRRAIDTAIPACNGWTISEFSLEGCTGRCATVRIGSVYDTQRRRRNGLTEVYSASTVTL